MRAAGDNTAVFPSVREYTPKDQNLALSPRAGGLDKNSALTSLLPLL